MLGILVLFVFELFVLVLLNLKIGLGFFGGFLERDFRMGFLFEVFVFGVILFCFLRVLFLGFVVLVDFCILREIRWLGVMIDCGYLISCNFFLFEEGCFESCSFGGFIGLFSIEKLGGIGFCKCCLVGSLNKLFEFLGVEISFLIRSKLEVGIDVLLLLIIVMLVIGLCDCNKLFLGLLIVLVLFFVY